MHQQIGLHKQPVKGMEGGKLKNTTLVTVNDYERTDLSMNFMEEYKQKLITPEKAAQLVKSGDFVGYGHFNLFPAEFDKALGNRAGE